MTLPRWVARFGKFGSVGAFNNAADLVLFAVLHFWTGVPVVAANTLSFVAIATASYFLHKNWTFSDRMAAATARSFVTFLLLNGLMLAVSNFVVWAMTPVAHAIIAKLLAILMTTLISLWSYQRFVFQAAAPGGALDRQPTGGRRL